MEFRLLGPLEAVDDGRTLPLGGTKQRALLAVLLLSANETVPGERLVDALWGERPPATATKAIQVYVSGLRRVVGADRLQTRGRGYAIVAVPEEIDVARFERLTAEGRRALAAGAHAEAAERLATALALWRGPALADLAAEPFAEPAAARLEELRLAALETRLDADLLLGRHAELVGELEGLVAGEPLRERPRRQLMLALYRSGRQAEALAAYQEARTTLVEELGIEPGPELQELERAILRQDASLAAPATAAQASDGARLVAVLCALVDRPPELDRGRADEAARRLLELRGRVKRELLSAHGGREVESVGEGLVATFGSARAAVGAAVALGRAAADQGLGARVGVNLGEAETASGHPYGAALAAERIAAAAAPGTILVSEAVRNLAGQATGAEFHDRGRLPVEGYPEPWHLYEAVAEAPTPPARA
jgi:DNA-binding SARP family transcriptional activator